MGNRRKKTQRKAGGSSRNEEATFTFNIYDTPAQAAKAADLADQNSPLIDACYQENAIEAVQRIISSGMRRPCAPMRPHARHSASHVRCQRQLGVRDGTNCASGLCFQRRPCVVRLALGGWGRGGQGEQLGYVDQSS